MIPTSDTTPATTPSATEFYDALAPDYDTMTGFQKRFVHEKPFFRLLKEKHNITVALDAGCGTGFHALLLAQLGVQMTGVDVSTAMIARARKHAEEMSLQVHFVVARNAELGGVFGPRFDAVFSLGNTMAHLLSDEELHATMRSFHAILKPRGILLLQNLNYDRILTQQQRVQSIKEVDGTTFIRFYDFQDPLIIFNILTIDRKGGELHQSHKTVALRPLPSDYLSKSLRENGFSQIRLFGGIALDPYNAESSKDLVILAEKEE